jgi:hypothetical protein
MASDSGVNLPEKNKKELQDHAEIFGNKIVEQFPDTFMDEDHTQDEIRQNARPINSALVSVVNRNYSFLFNELGKNIAKELKDALEELKSNHIREEKVSVDNAWVEILDQYHAPDKIINATMAERKTMASPEQYRAIVRKIREESLEIIEIFKRKEVDLDSSYQRKLTKESSRLKNLINKEIKKTLENKNMNLAARMVISSNFTSFPTYLGHIFKLNEIAIEILNQAKLLPQSTNKI